MEKLAEALQGIAKVMTEAKGLGREEYRVVVHWLGSGMYRKAQKWFLLLLILQQRRRTRG